MEELAPALAPAPGADPSASELWEPTEAMAALVGYAGIARLGRKRPFEYEIHTIGVDPEYQGRGIGRRLLSETFTIAADGSVTSG